MTALMIIQEGGMRAERHTVPPLMRTEPSMFIAAPTTHSGIARQKTT